MKLIIDNIIVSYTGEVHTIGKVINWNIDDGCPDENILDRLKYITLETEEEYYIIHDKFDVLPKCKNISPELVNYYGDIARFIVGNL